jgi:hypothetical protein
MRALLIPLDRKVPYKGLGDDSEEKREPVSDINTAVVDSLKALEPKRPSAPPILTRPYRKRRAAESLGPSHTAGIAENLAIETSADCQHDHSVLFEGRPRNLHHHEWPMRRVGFAKSPDWID